ncbi:MAG TPA: endolytic transglycosylase MltG, partial [Desulfobulbus sp.]|nr:endolytic transglycosylase MltG [Desulfobulbus sp.]
MRSLLLWSAGSCLIFLLGLIAWYEIYVTTPATGSGMATVFIPKGAGLRRIETILAGQGVIRDDPRFLILARLSGSSDRLRAGEFAIARNLLPAEVLDILMRGEVIHHRMTIPEGLTMARIAILFAQADWADEKEFLALCNDPKFIHGLGINEASLEGYLFPDTYILVRGETTTRSIITTMVRRFLNIWKEVAPENKSLLTRHQVVT